MTQRIRLCPGCDNQPLEVDEEFCKRCMKMIEDQYEQKLEESKNKRTLVTWHANAKN